MREMNYEDLRYQLEAAFAKAVTHEKSLSGLDVPIRVMFPDAETYPIEEISYDPHTKTVMIHATE